MLFSLKWNESLINNDELYRNKAAVVYFKVLSHYPPVGGVEENTEASSQNRRFTGRDSKGVPHEYKPQALRLEVICFNSFWYGLNLNTSWKYNKLCIFHISLSVPTAIIQLSDEVRI